MNQTKCIRQAKIDLVAALRSAAKLGLHEGVCNHFSYAVQTGSDADVFLLNPHGVHWEEVLPEDIVTMDVHGQRLDGHREVEPTAFNIHAAVHTAKKSARCIMHTHMPYATAITACEGGKLEWISQNAVRYYDRVAYDTEYGGLALEEDEGKRIASKLGEDKDILFMANHGVLLCGESIANVMDDLYYLERACMVQVLAMSTGMPLKRIPDDVALHTMQQTESERRQSVLHFDALKRRLDASDPGWSVLPA